MGHVLAEYNWGLTRCLELNLTKVHIPVKCSHDFLDIPCNDFFGLGMNERITETLINQAINGGQLKRVVIEAKDNEKAEAIRLLNAAVVAHPEDGVVFVVNKTHEYDFSRTRKWWQNRLVMAKEKSPTWAEYPSLAKYDPTCINVALHIRRGDVVLKSLLNRFTANEFYIKTFKILESLFPNHRVVGHFFSQGEIEDFVDISESLPGHPIYLKGTALGDLRGLMDCDILVGAKSGYSYLAAMLADMMVVALPTWFADYSYMTSVVMADEMSENPFDAKEFVRVWNQRTPEQRKGALAELPLNSTNVLIAEK